MSEKVDKYGRRGITLDEPLPYKVDSSTDGTTYMCFSDEAETMIHRYVTADGVTTTTKAWGAWANRATLTYVAINALYEV